MNIDIKHDLLKNFQSDLKLGQKNVQTTIDQSMVAGAKQKSLGMDLQNDGLKNNDLKKKKKKQKIIKETKKNEILKQQTDNVERDPIKLLNLL